MIWRLQTAILLLTQKCVTASVDLKVMVKYSVDSTIQGEYIGCCHIINQVFATAGDKEEAAKLIVSECIQQGYLVDFLNKHKVEVISMFESLFDEKLLRRLMIMRSEKKPVKKAVKKASLPL